MAKYSLKESLNTIFLQGRYALGHSNPILNIFKIAYVTWHTKLPLFKLMYPHFIIRNSINFIAKVKKNISLSERWVTTLEEILNELLIGNAIAVDIVNHISIITFKEVFIIFKTFCHNIYLILYYFQQRLNNDQLFPPANNLSKPINLRTSSVNTLYIFQKKPRSF